MSSAPKKPALCRRLCRRDEKRIERRAAIIAIASRSFLEKGYAGTAMSSISAEMGGSKATLWNYFSSKEELFEAFLDQATETFRRELLSVLDPAAELRPAIEAFCRRFIRKILSPEAIAMHRLVTGESGRSPEIGRMFYDRGPGATEMMLTDFLTRHRAAGRLKPVPPVEMARFLLSYCIGRSHSRAVLGIEMPDDREIDARAATITETFFTLYGQERTC